MLCSFVFVCLMFCWCVYVCAVCWCVFVLFSCRLFCSVSLFTCVCCCVFVFLSRLVVFCSCRCFDLLVGSFIACAVLALVWL